MAITYQPVTGGGVRHHAGPDPYDTTAAAQLGGGERAAREWAARDWQRADRLDLGPLAGSVPCARLHARAIVREWDLTALADDAEILVSELVTNAIRASDEAVTLRLRTDWQVLLIEVEDVAPGIPQAAPHPPDAESGHGLEIVTALSERWGFYHPRGGGKVVWAALRVSPG